ncbi:MAG: serine protease, partial [Myxococcales bacterium]|nr:serine protease [Myxococcales bacterium]
MRHLLPLLALAAAACGNLNDKVDEVEVNDRGDNAIVGGSNAAEGQFAHQVSLQTRSGFHYCGASLIADGWVLTAAHCVDDPASQMRVRIGTTRSNSGGQLFNVTRKIRHPSYNANTMDNDVALLELSTSTGSLTTVPLANDAADDGISAAGQMATVSGWGALSESGSSPTALQYVEVPLLTNSSCNVSYNGDITARMVCAGYAQGGQDSCQGDSGGPMVVDNGGSWVQNGVV